MKSLKCSSASFMPHLLSLPAALWLARAPAPSKGGHNGPAWKVGVTRQSVDPLILSFDIHRSPSTSTPQLHMHREALLLWRAWHRGGEGPGDRLSRRVLNGRSWWRLIWDVAVGPWYRQNPGFFPPKRFGDEPPHVAEVQRRKRRSPLGFDPLP